MKKILVMLALVFACLWGTAFAADFSQLVILHTNDTHGYDQRADGVNGMATVAALKEDYEAKGYKVLLVDAGDAIQDNNLVNFSKGKGEVFHAGTRIEDGRLVSNGGRVLSATARAATSTFTWPTSAVPNSVCRCRLDSAT